MRFASRALLAVWIVLAPLQMAAAEEGMWLFNDFPAQKVAAAYGFAPTLQWLDKVRLGAVRLAGGCSASFVSDKGLVMTNHHCIRSCIEDLSTPKLDLLARGFLARAQKDERRCPGMEANQLTEITDVTLQVQKATAGRTGEDFARALKEVSSKLEGDCATGTAVRCDVVTLFHGGAYHLYRYRRFQDVRLVFAPEFTMAAFGGDPDNFNFPRYAFDVAFLRVFDGGSPALTPEHLPWAKEPVKEGDLVFVPGHPGGTERVQTVEQLELQRDVVLPYFLLTFAELRGVLLEFQAGSPERHRTTRARLRRVENVLKAMRGRHQWLGDPAFFAAKKEQDQALRRKVRGDPALEARFGGAFEGISQAVAAQRALHLEYRLLEGADGFRSELFNQARRLVRAADERPKPSGQRLREYSDARLPAMEQAISMTAPVPADFEEKTLAFSLRRLRELLGADHPLVQKVIGRQAPEAMARTLVRGTRLADPATRQALYRGGTKAIEASADPMIALARLVDADARAVRQSWEAQVEGALARHGELLNQAHVAVYGQGGYPDATFTLRLSYGTVQGWTEGGTVFPAMTTVGGLYRRDAGVFPFAVEPSWLAAKKRLAAHTPMNLVTTNDIIGGNSGSPLVDRNGHVVGLVFDGNLPSLAGRYGYDPAVNRTVAVHAEVITAALEHVYRAHRVLEELVGSR
jgi:hypothetical protein